MPCPLQSSTVSRSRGFTFRMCMSHARALPTSHRRSTFCARDAPDEALTARFRIWRGTPFCAEPS
eukprot:4947230-Alexandrium_andersonii.AAC.1